MSADVLSPSKPRPVSSKVLAHLVGRPLVPFFESDSEHGATAPSYEANDFAIPEHLKLASRKFVNGYWVNEDGSTAQIGENTPTLINTNATILAVEKSAQKSPQRTSSHPTQKSLNTPVNGQRGKHGKKAQNNLVNNDTTIAPGPAPSRSHSETKVKSQSNKANKNKSTQPKSPPLTSAPSSNLSYAAIVAKSSDSPANSAQNSPNEKDTFQTPFKGKKQSSNAANTTNAAQKNTTATNGFAMSSTKSDNKENFAALASPAPTNIPMPKFLSTSPPSSNNGNPAKSPPTSIASVSSELTSLSLNSPVSPSANTLNSVSSHSALSSNSSSTVFENAEKGAQLLNLLKKGLVTNTDSTASTPTSTPQHSTSNVANPFPANAFPPHYSYTYPYPAHNPSAAYPYAAAYHPAYANAMLAHAHGAHYPMQPATAASVTTTTSTLPSANASPSLMLLTNDGRGGSENSVKNVPINSSSNTQPVANQLHTPPYSLPLSHGHPYSSTAYHPHTHTHTHSLTSMPYSHFSPPSIPSYMNSNAALSASSASASSFSSSALASNSSFGGQPHYPVYSQSAAPSH